MTVYRQSIFLLCLLACLPAVAKRPRSKPRLMPSRVVEEETPTGGSDSIRPESHLSESPSSSKSVKLGAQFGTIFAAGSSGSLFSANQVMMGGRLFTRLGMGGRWYLFPYVGFYRQVMQGYGNLSAPSLLEMGADINYALVKIGRLSLLGGLSQKVDWQFNSTVLGASGGWYYRLGPDVTLNFRLNRTISLTAATDLTFTITNPTIPSWGMHGGLLFSF